MIALTLDIEWAPDDVVDECINLLVSKNIPATLFCTNHELDESGKSTVLTNRYPGNIELGIHPNFDQDKDFAAVLRRLLRFYPDTQGFRSHHTLTSWTLSVLANEVGLHYESNYMLYGLRVQPFKINMESLDLYNFPIYYMDHPTLTIHNFNWHYKTLNGCDLFDKPDELFVFDFHPNILFYDLKHQHEYNELKMSYHEVNHQQSYRHKNLEGAMRMYQSLINNFPADTFTTVDGYGVDHNLW